MADSTLRRELRKREPFDLPEEETHLNLVRTHEVLARRMARILKAHGLSGPQYNILRILRGLGGEGARCQEIVERMVTRDPDVTRLVDRLVEAKLVERHRSRDDRRVVRVTLTKDGRALVGELDEPVRAAHRRNLGHLTAGEFADLNRLLVKARQGKEAEKEA